MKPFILFGTGDIANQISDWLGNGNIGYYVDNNRDKIGKKFRDKEIISVHELLEIHGLYEVIIAVGENFIREIASQLDELKIPYTCLWDLPFYFIQGKRKFISPREIVSNNHLQDLNKVLIWGNTLFGTAVKEELERENVGVEVVNCNDVQSHNMFVIEKDTIDAYIISFPNNDMHIGMDKAQEIRAWILKGAKGKVVDCFDQDCFERVFYNKELEKYKGYGKGKRCFIIGNGPSLRAEDLQILYEHGEITFASNRIDKIFDKTSWTPTFYGCVDQLVLLQHTSEIDRIKCKEKFILDYQNRGIELPQEMKAEIVHIIAMEYNSKGYPKFSDDISRGIYMGYTVTYALLQIACYMGFGEIILLGVDHSDFRKHFVRDYCDPNEKIFEGSYERLAYQAYISAKEYCDLHKIKILNATRGGALEIFNRVIFDDLFA